MMEKIPESTEDNFDYTTWGASMMGTFYNDPDMSFDEFEDAAGYWTGQTLTGFKWNPENTDFDDFDFKQAFQDAGGSDGEGGFDFGTCLTDPASCESHFEENQEQFKIDGFEYHDNTSLDSCGDGTCTTDEEGFCPFDCGFGDGFYEDTYDDNGEFTFEFDGGTTTGGSTDGGTTTGGSTDGGTTTGGSTDGGTTTGGSTDGGSGGFGDDGGSGGFGGDGGSGGFGG